MIQLLVKGDEFLFERHLKRVLVKLVDPATRDFNFDRVSLREMKVVALVDLLRTLPMMASSRTVVASDADKIPTEGVSTLLAYLANPSPDAHLILIADKFDKRTALAKTLSKTAEVIEFKTPYLNQVPAFIQDEAAGLGLKLARGCAQLLVEIVGQDLMTLSGELEKIATYIAPRKEVQEQDIEDIVARGLISNIYEMGGLIARRDLAGARALATRMSEQGEPLIRTVAILITHFRKLLLTREAAFSESRAVPASAGDLAHILGVNPYFVKDYLGQAKRFTMAELKRVFVRLMDLSENLRSSPLHKDGLFEDFLQNVCLAA